MRLKYTILKVLIRNLNKGFTLLELIIGLSIMVLIGGFAMNAFIDSSKTFSNDKKNIDSSQNLSAILELIGNDIKQSGEQIADSKFPVIKIEPNNDTLPAGESPPLAGSSKITIVRALTTSLTLCQSIAANAVSVPSNLIAVADNSQAATDANCAPGTLTTTTTPSSISRPAALREARNYRCKLDNLNADYTVTNTDFCLSTKASPDLEQVRAAVSDSAGNIRTFNYIDDAVDTVAAANTKFNIQINNLSASTPVDHGYAIGRPIYLIEERTYSLHQDGNLKLQINGGSREILISNIQKFNISARVYGDKTTKQPDAIDPTSTISGTTNILPLARRCDAAVPYYICEFKSSTYANDDWKTLQGIKVELRSKYNSSGQSATASAKDLEKLSAVAEFFPRNVLSK